MMIPPLTFSSGSTLFTRTRSCRGFTFIVCSLLIGFWGLLKRLNELLEQIHRCWHSTQQSANNSRRGPGMSRGHSRWILSVQNVVGGWGWTDAQETIYFDTEPRKAPSVKSSGRRQE